MKNERTHTDPNSGFIIVKNERLSNLAGESIDLLYQPIIGVEATALIRLLWRYSDIQTEPFLQHPHYELFSFLQMDAARFNEYRIKLEGAGLLKTYIQATDSKPVRIYQLVVPLSNRQFFNDDLLSLALLENLGEELYQKLAKQLLIKPFDTNGMHEITQNFLDSFQIDADQITDQPQTIANLKNNYRLNQSPQPSSLNAEPSFTDAREFDFKLVLDCLNKTYVNIDQVKKYYELINNEHQLYGIDEVKMAKTIVRATNVKNNVFDPEKLKMLISRMYQSTTKSPVNQESNPTNSTNQTDLKQGERALIDSAEHYAPISFLYKIKRQRNGFVSKDEENLVAELVDQHLMSTGAINMLIYHIILDQEKPKLVKGLFNYIANDWAQKYHVQTATDAMNAIKAYNKQSNQRANRGNGYYRNNHTPTNKVEPAWLYEDENADNDDDKLTDAELKEVKEKLRRLNER